MKLTRKYQGVFFSAEVVQEVVSVLFDGREGDIDTISLSAIVDGDEWAHDNDDEFFADYRKSNGNFSIRKQIGGIDIHLYGTDFVLSAAVSAPTRELIHRTFEVLEKYHNESKIPEDIESAEKPVVFIGHGRSQMWRDLRDHLQDKHDYEIEAYEIGSRSGHTIRDILQTMLSRSSFALLVMTAEDETASGDMRARQNVVHECGLFQGKLGFSKAIVLIEDETEGFSNLQGIEQIRFAKNNIKETYGEVLATLKREFE